jgi:iron complex outermembrane receptor protein
MRIARSTLIGTAVAMALFGGNETVRAQTATANSAATTPNNTNELQEVVVTGIRASLQESLEVKRLATSAVDVITAEDIGKMPDKNIADSLKRVPGVTASSAGANEGGFDENDRISMRGTGPSLTQTLIDGHNLASGDWFVLDQTGTVGRSVSYTLLPSELVSQVIVHKSSEASLVEGGVAGTVDIITRKPLDFGKPFTFEASAGAVYADLPSKSDPQLNALLNWKNPDSTFGVLLQGFYEQRHLRRDGVELLGYDTIGPCSQVVTGTSGGQGVPLTGGGCSAPGPVTLTPHANLANVQYPTDIGAAFFTQERKRTGGLVNVQWKPSDAVSFDLSGFYSDLDAPNYNRNYLLWDTHYINFGAGQAPDPGYTVVNNTLTNAHFTGVPGTLYGIYDQISRPDERADSAFINLDGKFVLSEQLRLDAQAGTSKGHGRSPTQNVSETSPGAGAGAYWQLNGIGSGPNFNLIGVNNTQPFPPGKPATLTFGWIFGAQDVDTYDKESWGKLDATFTTPDSGAWKDLKFGVRYTEHDRNSVGSIAQGPTFSGGPSGAGGVSPLNYPTTYSNYPGNFNTFGGQIPTGVWYWTPAQLAVYDCCGNTQRDPVQRAYPPYWFGLTEKDTAAYVQGDFKGDRWTANVGLRYVRTGEDTISYIPLACSASIPASANPCPANTPNLVVGSLFGAFAGVPVSETYNDFLPSANFRWEFDKELIGRVAVAETMTRADYSALSGATSLTPPGNFESGGVQNQGSGSGSNPYLKPIRSYNYDAGLEWYFAPHSLLSATLFYMDLKNFIGNGSEVLNYPTSGSVASGFPPGLVNVPYLLTVPVNATGRAQGIETSWQQSFFEHWGIDANYTYTDGKQTSFGPQAPGTPPPTDDRLLGTSKNTYNIGGYYEDAHLSARVSYNYRSAFYSGLDRSTAFSQDSVGTLAATLAWIVNDNLSVNLDGQNLNNPTLKYYALNTDQPRAFYKNGRQYYLTLHAKF